MKGQRVVIIGGSSGIGLEIARLASALEASLILVGRDREKLASVATRLDVEKTVPLDAHDEGELELFFSTLDAIDHLVSMVGDSMSGGFLSTSPETMRKVWHSKFFTNWRIGQYAATKLRAGGSLTFTSGTGGRAHEISATYVANLGIGALVEGLASELAPRVRVNAVAPTFMATPFWRDVPPAALEAAQAAFRETVPLARLATTSEVASTYVHLMTNSFVTGQTLAVDGGVMLRK